MADEFPEKGEFIAPHIARNKPDCDKRPLVPDPCEIRPGRRKASTTDFDCVATPDKIICPSDLIASHIPEDVETPKTPLPPFPTPPPTAPPRPTPPPDKVPNKEQTASCPTSYIELGALGCNANDLDFLGPDPSGNWPILGSRVIVPAGSFYADTQEEADILAKQFACSHLECCHGNLEEIGKCEDLLSSNDIDFLKLINVWNDSDDTSELVKGDPITIPANVFVNCETSEDAQNLAKEELTSLLADTCYSCNPVAHCPCPNDAEPNEGYTAEECSFQGRIVETSTEQLYTKALDYVGSICDCFEMPDIELPCPPKILLDNPNETDCGVTSLGSPSGVYASDGSNDCTIPIELPEIPCPCGYTMEATINNPNQKPQGSWDPSPWFFHDPGGTAGPIVATATTDECKFEWDYTPPEVPVGNFPQIPAGGGGGGGGGGGPCPGGIQVELCVAGKKTRTKSKWWDPSKNDADPTVDDVSCECENCPAWSASGGMLEGDIVSFENEGDFICFEVLREINGHIEPFKTPGWQNYFLSGNHRCGEGGNTCEKGEQVVEEVPEEEEADDDDPCIIKLPCIEICDLLKVSNDEVEFKVEGMPVGAIELIKTLDDPETYANDCGLKLIGDIDIPVCQFLDATDNQVDINFNGELRGSIGLRKALGNDCLFDLYSPNDVDLNYCPKGNPNKTVGIFDFDSTDEYGYAVAGAELGRLGYRVNNDCEGEVFGNDIILPKTCALVKSSPISFKADGKSLGQIDIALTNDCEVTFKGNDIELNIPTSNDLCPSTSDDTIAISVNGDEKGIIGITSGPTLSDDGQYESQPGSCEFKLTGNDIDLEICPEVESSESYVVFQANGEDIGTVELGVVDCKLQFTGGPIDITSYANGNDIDVCPEISAENYVNVEDDYGNILGTITLSKTDDCKLKLTTNGITIPTFDVNDADFPYEEKDIEICTESGTETYTILVKKTP